MVHGRRGPVRRRGRRRAVRCAVVERWIVLDGAGRGVHIELSREGGIERRRKVWKRRVSDGTAARVQRRVERAAAHG